MIRLMSSSFQRADYTLILCGVGTSLLTACMLILAFHPYNYWYFAFFALVPMLIAQNAILPEKWSGLADVVGIGGWLLVFLTSLFGSDPSARVIQIVVAVIVSISLFTTPSLIHFHRQTSYRWFVLQGVGGWMGIEMIRSFIPIINTHAFIAQTMYTQPWMLQPMSIFSIYGLGIVLVLLNYAFALVILVLYNEKWNSEIVSFQSKNNAFAWLTVALTVLVFWLGTSWTILSDAEKKEPVIKVAAIQHNFPIPGHQDTKESQPMRFRALSEQANIAAKQGAQLIVMPELGLGFDPQVEFTNEFIQLAEETGAYLLIGYGLDDPMGWRNEAVMLTPQGNFLDVYGKNHPTSPGEPQIVTAGKYPVYETSLGPLATIICNDVHWTNSSRILSRKGARLISVPTLEMPGIALEQVAQSVMRAVENRIAVIKSDAAYASAIIDPYGNIVALKNGSPNGAAFALIGDISLVYEITNYTKYGDWPGWLSLLIFIYFIIYQEVIRQRKKKSLVEKL